MDPKASLALQESSDIQIVKYLKFDFTSHFWLMGKCSNLTLVPYSKLSMIRPGHSRILKFEKKIALVV